MSGTLDFPASPTVGQTYTANGITFFWTGTNWEPRSSADLLATSLNSGGAGAFRNVLINSAFQLWQRGTPITNPATNTFSADRWRTEWNGSGGTRVLSYNRSISEKGLPPGVDTYMRYDHSVLGSAGTFETLQQRVENVFTLQGDWVTLSFYARAIGSPVTMSDIFLEHRYGTGGTPTANETHTLVSNVVIAASPEFRRYSYSMFLPWVTGTLGTNEDDNLSVRFGLQHTVTKTFDLTACQLERGTVATPYEVRPIGIELTMAQRYAARSTLHIQSPVSGVGGSQMLVPIYFPTQMRAQPSRTTISAGTTGGNATITFESATDAWGGYFQITPTAATAYWIDRQNIYSAEL